MNSTMKILANGVGALALTLTALALLPSADASAEPTCADVEFLDIDQHGDHVVRDYVIGEDGTGPAGEGAEIPGGPGPRFHFLLGISPGASFCTDSRSPGAPPGLDGSTPWMQE